MRTGAEGSGRCAAPVGVALAEDGADDVQREVQVEVVVGSVVGVVAMVRLLVGTIGTDRPDMKRLDISRLHMHRLGTIQVPINRPRLIQLDIDRLDIDRLDIESLGVLDLAAEPRCTVLLAGPDPGALAIAIGRRPLGPGPTKVRRLGRGRSLGRIGRAEAGASDERAVASFVAPGHLVEPTCRITTPPRSSGEIAERRRHAIRGLCPRSKLRGYRSARVRSAYGVAWMVPGAGHRTSWGLLSAAGPAMRVLKVVHSGVVSAWRERERALVRRGVDVQVVSARVWDEGGRSVVFEPDGEEVAMGVRTWGDRPNLFVFDPRPLWRLLGEEWDVVDVHEEPCSLAAAEILLMARLRRLRAPVVLYSAQNIAKRYPPPFRWTERAALRRAAAVSVCNAAAGRILVDKGFRGCVAEIPLGVDAGVFAPGSTMAPEAGLRIGYVGRLAAHKGVRHLLDSVTSRPAWTVDLVGGGPEEGALRDQAERLGIADRVHFAGPAEQDALVAWYRRFDVVVVPSVPTTGWEEQFCRVAVEAMASGVPVVASRSGALPEVVGDAGLLVKPGDGDALRVALDRVASEPGCWSGLRTAGLARATRFSWDSVADSYLDVYLRVTDRPDAPARTAAGTGPSPDPGAGPPPEIIVVAYGGADLVDGCLAALGGGTSPIVVDNSSNPATRAVTERHGGRYLDPGRNLGFAGGVNHGLRHVEPGRDVLLLNPDAIVTPADIVGLQRRLRADPGLAAVAPSQVDPADGSPAQVTWPVPSPAGAWLEAVGLGRARWGPTFVIGSVLLLRAEALAEIGGLDERFFLYAEETDWEMRAQSAGWRVAECPEIVASHIGAGTGGDPQRRETYFHASHERLLRKHHGRRGWLVYRLATVAGAGVRALLPPPGRRATARLQLRLYLRGPCRAEAALPAPPDATGTGRP